MGCTTSTVGSTRDSTAVTTTFEGIRVVHSTGHVEDLIDGPITVGDITGTPPKGFLCTPAQLRSFGFEPFRLDHQLESGRIYFLVPNSVFESESSPLDHNILAAKLTSIAMNPSTRAYTRTIGGSGRPENGSMGFATLYGSGSCCRVGSWKPTLDSIQERFEMRSGDVV